MRRAIAVLVLTLGVGVPVSLAAVGKGTDVATGHGTAACSPSTCTFTTRDFQFAGTSNLKSGKAHGVLREVNYSRSTPTVVTGTLRAKVFCVTVTGKHAVLGAVVDRSTGAALAVGTVLYVPADDLGKTGDLFGPNYITGTPPADVAGQCTLDFPALMSVVRGDVRAKDGQT